jgi:hypothetical protein
MLRVVCNAMAEEGRQYNTKFHVPQTNYIAVQHTLCTGPIEAVRWSGLQQ